jgi:hypothetical protein
MSHVSEKSFGEFFAAALVALLLAGCNGGGGSSSTPALFKSVTLNGAQENPSVTTAATGVGFITVEESSGAVRGNFSTFGISGNAAHIHEGAAGVNGGILVELTQGPPGTWTVPGGAMLTPAQVESFKAGGLYVNVHTTANPNGETRGQVGRQVWFATLTGAQEVPPTTSAATGTGRWTFDPETRTLAGTVTQTGVAATVAHIHTGAIGVAAPVTIPFTGGPSNWISPPTVLTEAQAASLAAGNFYANVHSAAFPGGEIRGQLYLPAHVANLSGAQEVPPNASTATGTGWFMVNPFTRAIAGRMEWSGVAATDAHIHRAAPGVAGGIVIRGTVAPGVLTINSATPLADDLFLAFMQGNLYYNVHSAAVPAGEIRGQLVSGQ